jgi:hypothetical protein
MLNELSRLGNNAKTHKILITCNLLHTEFGWENLRERDHFEDPDVDGWMTLN